MVDPRFDVALAVKIGSREGEKHQDRGVQDPDAAALAPEARASSEPLGDLAGAKARRAGSRFPLLHQSCLGGRLTTVTSHSPEPKPPACPCDRRRAEDRPPSGRR